MTIGDETASHQYAAFGLTISSEISFPELLPSPQTGGPEITIQWGSVPSQGETPEKKPRLVFDDATEFTLHYEACSILVREGTEIIVDPAEQASAQDVRWVVLGPAFNFLLHQRGHLVLHASTVAVDGFAVAFLGESGAGKSTTAAAFVDAGHTALSDDVAAIDTSSSNPVVQPGFSSLKLHDEIGSRFRHHLTAVTAESHTNRSSTEAAERFYRVDDPQLEPQPLAAIYRLTDGEEITIDQCEPATAAVELARNTYTIGTQDRCDEASHGLTLAADVAETVPVYTLRRPRKFESLSDVIHCVEKEVSA